MTTVAWDVAMLRSEFPILESSSRGKPLVYLDSGATTQKPRAVIDAITRFYESGNANIHRGVYQLSEQATIAWDATRHSVAQFLGGVPDEEIVFTRGTTEGVNIVAQCFVRPTLRAGDRVLVTTMEHHANIVPWQMVGATTVPIPITPAGELDLAAAEALLATRPKLLAVVHVSNALGTINPIAELCRMARAQGVPVLVDGAQAVSHFPVDVRALGCDFYCFSSHKLFGPTGFGVLWAKAEHLEKMPPAQGGGDMIDRVTFEGTTFAPSPQKFEAGTPHIAGAIGLGAAIEWLESQDREAIHAHEVSLLEAGTAALQAIPGLTLVGTAADKVGILTFTMDGIHPHDIASLLDGEGVCIRAGHHCTQPLHNALGLAATARASLAPYNTLADVETLVSALHSARRIFG
ncbi:MAG: SufS family cysteine desulfurase [Gemmatimonadales bacterium]